MTVKGPPVYRRPPVHKMASEGGLFMSTIIGVTCAVRDAQRDDSEYYLRQAYVKSVIRAGGIPLLIPLLPESAINDCLDTLSAIIFSGGGDVAPTYFGQEPSLRLRHVEPQRDACELYMVKSAWEKKLPILGICRGIQLVNIALGGSVWQDLEDSPFPVLQHEQNAPYSHPSHKVISEAGYLRKLAGREVLMVNSFHHQAVNAVGLGLKVTARASDGIIEALEADGGDRFCLCLQWHPEWLSGPLGQGCFDILLDAARGYG